MRMNPRLFNASSFRKRIPGFSILSVFFMYTVSLSAQPASLSLLLGPGSYARQDQIFSPFVHQDWSLLNVSLQYDWGKKNDQFTAIEFGSYNPILVPSYGYGDEDDVTYPHNFTLVNLTYGFGKRLAMAKENRALTLGGFFEADIQASTYNYAWLGTFGYLAPISIGIWSEYTYTLNAKNKFSGKLLLPVVSLVARSPYLANDDAFIENTYSHNGLKTFFAYLGDGKVQTWNRIQQVELQLGYDYALSSAWSIGATYAFRFQHVAKPLPFLSYRNTFYLHITRNFGS